MKEPHPNDLTYGDCPASSLSHTQEDREQLRRP